MACLGNLKVIQPSSPQGLRDDGPAGVRQDQDQSDHVLEWFLWVLLQQHNLLLNDNSDSNADADQWNEGIEKAQVKPQEGTVQNPFLLILIILKLLKVMDNARKGSKQDLMELANFWNDVSFQLHLPSLAPPTWSGRWHPNSSSWMYSPSSMGL